MRELVTESLRRRDIVNLLSVTEQLLQGQQVQWVKFVSAYTTKYGSPPSLNRFEAEFPSFVAVPCEDPLDDIFDVTMRKLRNEFARRFIMERQAVLRDGDPLEPINELHAILSADPKGCVTTATFDKSAYFRHVTSIPFGLPTIDNAVGGVCEGDLVYFVGRPGDGKTTLLLNTAANWYLRGKKILLVSNEIPWDDMLWKIDAMLAGFPWAEKRLGTFSEDTTRKVNFLKYISTQMGGTLITPRGPVMTPGEVGGLVTTYRPDAVLIDGVYLMSLTGKPVTDWQDSAAVSRELKQIATKNNVRVVGVVQANRKAEEMGSNITGAGIAGTDAYNQDCDTALGIRSVRNDGRYRHLTVNTTKNRNGAPAVANVVIDYASVRIFEEPAK